MLPSAADAAVALRGVDVVRWRRPRPSETFRPGGRLACASRAYPACCYPTSHTHKEVSDRVRASPTSTWRQPQRPGAIQRRHHADPHAIADRRRPGRAEVGTRDRPASVRAYLSGKLAAHRDGNGRGVSIWYGDLRAWLTAEVIAPAAAVTPRARSREPTCAAGRMPASRPGTRICSPRRSSSAGAALAPLRVRDRLEDRPGPDVRERVPARAVDGARPASHGRC
jgi:hypothetical protein